MADYVPLILIGGLAVGGFILWKQGVFNNLFTPPPAPAPVSASSSTSTSTPCMGTDILSGQPCSCPSSSTAGMAYAYAIERERVRSGNKYIIYPGIPGSILPGSIGTIPGSFSTTCDCSRCGQSSILGGISPSQFSTSGGDINNFVGQAIAQAGYRIG